jgi:hypothetical protein
VLHALAISEDPVENLQLGLGLELSVLPPYLYALWSIKPRSEGASGAAVEASNVLRVVAYEEMLHVGLLANILNALGAAPCLTRYLMRYPGSLPGHVTKGRYAFEVGLRPLSREAVDTYLRIERPEWEPLPPQDLREGDWKTIGEFYDVLKKQLSALPAKDFGHGRQVPARDNPGSGRLIGVSDLDSALEAINIIVDQGEGHRPKEREATELNYYHEVAHYFQFKAIEHYFDGKPPIDPERDVYPVIANPDAARYSAKQQAASRDFNKRYTALIDALQSALTLPAPGVWGVPTQLMTGLAHAAAVLRNCGKIPGEDCVAGPTFEYLRGGAI